MKYLLDTCTISELTKPQANGGVIKWLENIDAESLYLSVINIGEIKRGINKLPTSRKKQNLLFWLETLLEDYQDRLLTVDLSVMENWSLMVADAERKGQPIAYFR
ncbi:MAG: VapC toxin family PIN domain ribonuclease [Methylococcaceae bacterium]|nr:VapC toxin family PIN domain ribonuclease [Methylococcaceae bacterium]